MSNYDERRSDFTRREEERTVKVGEIRGRVTGSIKKLIT